MPSIKENTFIFEVAAPNRVGKIPAFMSKVHTGGIYRRLLVFTLVVACQQYVCPNVISMTMNVFIFRNLSLKTV